MYKQISIISLLFILLAFGEAQLVINNLEQSKKVNYSVISQGSQKCIKKDTLQQDKYLQPGQQLFSNRYSAVLQHDGNFVIYLNLRVIWSSNTYGRGGVKLLMQSDGNLVLYAQQDRLVWASNTAGKGIPPFRLVMQADRNLVIYDGRNQPTWATETNI